MSYLSQSSHQRLPLVPMVVAVAGEPSWKSVHMIRRGYRHREQLQRVDQKSVRELTTGIGFDSCEMATAYHFLYQCYTHSHLGGRRGQSCEGYVRTRMQVRPRQILGHVLRYKIVNYVKSWWPRCIHASRIPNQRGVYSCWHWEFPLIGMTVRKWMWAGACPRHSSRGRWTTATKTSMAVTYFWK